MKRIVIYADGTWNTPANLEEGDVASTNVYEMFKRTEDELTHPGQNEITQVKFYNEGVGTLGGSDKYTGGLFGKGINENIKEIYRFIVENYDKGDEIFLLGFSRGAYTVRSVAGLIRNCGILKRKYHQKVDRAFLIYRSRKPEDSPSSAECKFFRDSFCHEDRSDIKFMGVWDTVGSLGIPFQFFSFHKKYRFHDVELSSIVQNAYHAVSIDERRVFFKPSLWQKQKGKAHDGQELVQVWFNGVHSDVGGGYPKSTIQFAPLHYLQIKAEEHGLVFKAKYSEEELMQSALDKMHNSKDKLLYKVWPDYFRIINREGNHQLTAKQKAGNLWLRLLRLDVPAQASDLDTCEYLHISVYERYKKDPGKLPENLAPVFKALEANKRIIGWDAKPIA